MPASTEPTAATVPPGPSPLGRSLRMATAATLCLLVAEILNLTYASMAVWTTFLVMVKYDYTVFQKGAERLLGRFLGIGLGWILFALFPDAWGIRRCFESIAVLAFFYFYFSGRLAYTALNAGILLISVVSIGDSDPAMAYTAGWEMLPALAVGIAAADLVMWLSSNEGDLSIQTGLAPLLPVRLDWLNHSAMLMVSAFLALVLTSWVALPTPQSIISVFVIGIAPDIQQGLRKGELRLVGASLGLGWGLLTFVIVGHVPHLPVLMGMLFFGMLLAGYLARASTTYGYAGLQMGLVLPMLIVAPPGEFGDMDSVIARMEGVIAALTATLAVGAVWPPFYRTVEVPASSPVPALALPTQR